MLPHTHLNIKTFSDAIFVVYHIIAIFMELRSPSTIDVYATFQDLHVAVSLHASKEGYAITTKRSKKNKKWELRKVWMQCDKGGVFKAKGFGKREAAKRKDECLFMIIGT